MGIELLQEASNRSALIEMYRSMGLPWPGSIPPPPPSLPPSIPPSPFSSLDLYYRQAAAAHSLQRPTSLSPSFPYKMLPGSTGTPLPPSHSPLLPLPHLPHSAPLTPLSLPTASTILQEMSSEAVKSSPSPLSPLSLQARPTSVSPPRHSPPASPASPD